tara:strand:+ start:1879 stop:2463 length:585 start_codon:yes stop_codon:yes gene_type:complete
MKIFLILIIIFSFQSWAKGDDLRDFEIEGISIDDNLFDHFTEKQFEYAKKTSGIFYYKEDKFVELLFYKLPKFEIYDGVKITWKNSDKNYKIFSVTGIIYFKNNFDKCKVKREEVINDIENFLPNIINTGTEKINFRAEDSYALVTDLVINAPYEEIRVYCSNWSDIQENRGAWDALNVVINHPEFGKFMEDPY